MGLLVASKLRHQHSSAPSSYHLILRQSQCRSRIAPPDLKQHRVNWMGHQQWPLSPMPRLCVSMITFVIRSLCCNGSNGHFACATTSTSYFKTFSPGAPSSMLFGGINSNAEMYFGNATASNGPSVIAKHTFLDSIRKRHLYGAHPDYRCFHGRRIRQCDEEKSPGGSSQPHRFNWKFKI